ncbi:MAG TPA: hypothetical protein VHJ78_07065, partial [Actinomycetota bacterium]|nr:hypothetical protein [Actinomycetota bacterium]
MEADGTGQIRITTSDGFDTFPAWSPDGSKIAFDSVRDENREIYTMNPDGSDPRRLTDNRGIDRFPAWSPDGTRIAYYSERPNS